MSKFQFETEEQAKQMAQEEILKILNDKQYLNPDKFEKQYANQKQKIEALESQIAFTIKNQIENINQTRNFIDECFKNVEKCELDVEQLNNIYDQDARFYKDCESFEKLSMFRKNVGIMIDQLKYFFNVKQQIEKIEQQFHQGPEHYEQINYKLLSLTDIRDNVVENIKNDSKATSKEMQIIIQEFQTLSQFEEKFYSTIFSQFEMTLLVSLKNPVLLITLVRIVEAGDKILVSKGKEPKFKQRTLLSIQKGIDKKFEDRLKDQKEAIQVLENSKFTANDLILVLDHTVKCFPKHYEIFDVFEKSYKLNIEKRIIPFLEDEEEVKKSYGTLINLLNWVDSYDGLLLRVGLQDESYVLLKSKVKFYMPFFLEHIQSLIVDYSEKAILKDKEEQQTQANIEKLIKAKHELVTHFPEDIFHFINSQLDHLGPKLKGELFIELLRCVCQSVAEVQAREARSFIDNVPLTEEQGSSLSPVFLVTLCINNFYKCMSHANETKQHSIQFVGQDADLQERIEYIFSQDLSRSFNESITMFLEHMVKMVFYEVNSQLIPDLFQPRWINEDIVTQIISTLKDYLDDVQLLMVNQIYFNKLSKLVFINLINAYVDQIIMTVRYVQPSVAKNFFPRFLSDLTMMQDKKKKKSKDKKQGIINILQNKELIIPQIQHDCESLMNTIEQNYAQPVGKLTTDLLSKKFNLIITLLQKSKMELEGLNMPLIQTFNLNAVHILDIGLWIRDDGDAQFKQQRIDQILSLQNKQNIVV